MRLRRSEPEALVTARKDFVAGTIDRKTYEARMASRSQYRLKEKGGPDADGSQRFLYPDTRDVLLFDPATKKLLKTKPELPATFTLHADSPASVRVLKILQAFEYKSDKWRRWYGLRSHVEANNQFLKDDAHADLSNRNKRRPRGYAYQALASASAAAVSNLRRVVNFLKAVRDRADPPKHRVRRRTDEFGNRLPHRDACGVQQV